MDLLRLATAGNVDDGKSTLIGRLLLDGGALTEDQLSSVREASRRRSGDGLDLALVTDGLRAEREQGITIDVAYRYFSTSRRKFVLADCPGHVQYLRNLVTGVSTAGMVVVLVDARKGFVEQTRRHCLVASLMQVPHLVVCVNKMDLVGFAQEAFDRVREEFRAFSPKLDIKDVAFIPISALEGDNVVDVSSRTPWYKGRSLMTQLEDVHIASDRNLVDLRFSIQCVLRPRGEGPRYYAGTVCSGTLRPGDEVVALPSGFGGKVRRIWAGEKPVPEAQAGRAVAVTLDNELDLGRGDMLVRPNNRPNVAQDLDAMVCWMGAEALLPGRRYILRRGSFESQALIGEVIYKMDVNDLSRDPRDRTVTLNDLARVRLRVSSPVCYDPFKRNPATGSFILIDEAGCGTIAAGILH